MAFSANLLSACQCVSHQHVLSVKQRSLSIRNYSHHTLLGVVRSLWFYRTIPYKNHSTHYSIFFLKAALSVSSASMCVKLKRKTLSNTLTNQAPHVSPLRGFTLREYQRNFQGLILFPANVWMITNCARLKGFYDGRWLTPFEAITAHIKLLDWKTHSCLVGGLIRAFNLSLLSVSTDPRLLAF